MTDKDISRRHFLRNGAYLTVGAFLTSLGIYIGSIVSRPSCREATYSESEETSAEPTAKAAYAETTASFKAATSATESAASQLTQTPILEGLEALRKYKLETDSNVQIGNVRLHYDDWNDQWNTMPTGGAVKDRLAGMYGIEVDQDTEIEIQIRCVHGVPKSGVQGRITKNGAYETVLDLGVMLWAPFPEKEFVRVNLFATDSDEPVYSVSKEKEG
jgi:hypothetical protein